MIIIITVIILSVFISTHGDIELRIFMLNLGGIEEEKTVSGCAKGEGEQRSNIICIIILLPPMSHASSSSSSSRKLNITNFHEARTHTHTRSHTRSHIIWIIAFVHWILLLFSNTYITNNNYILSWSCDYHHRCQHHVNFAMQCDSRGRGDGGGGGHSGISILHIRIHVLYTHGVYLICEGRFYNLTKYHQWNNSQIAWRYILAIGCQILKMIPSAKINGDIYENGKSVRKYNTRKTAHQTNILIYYLIF